MPVCCVVCVEDEDMKCAVCCVASVSVGVFCVCVCLLVCFVCGGHSTVLVLFCIKL